MFTCSDFKVSKCHFKFNSGVLGYQICFVFLDDAATMLPTGCCDCSMIVSVILTGCYDNVIVVAGPTGFDDCTTADYDDHVTVTD